MPASDTGADLAITFGIEEEFFLVDPATGDLLADPDPAIFEACERAAGPHKVVREFLRSQIETNTRVCSSIADLRSAVLDTRRLVIEAAKPYRAVPMAASTHPFADWREQTPTPRERYERFAVIYQETVRRFLVGGMHIHAGFGDADSRVRVMTALRRHLPALHALSGSSPFNAGTNTGFKSFRLNLIGALPRTSLPPPMHSNADYQNLVEDYRYLDFIQNGSELWWDIRPSSHLPTVEMRICDVCTRIDDAMAVAALYATLLRKLLRDYHAGTLPAEPPTELIVENRWLAARYGVFAFLGDLSGGGRVDIDDHLQGLVADLAEDAAALDCEEELAHVLAIVREGTGADRQIDHYRLRRMEGDSEGEALRSVARRIIDETRQGVADA